MGLKRENKIRWPGLFQRTTGALAQIIFSGEHHRSGPSSTQWKMKSEHTVTPQNLPSLFTHSFLGHLTFHIAFHHYQSELDTLHFIISIGISSKKLEHHPGHFVGSI
jgi:hypothetical protein